MAIAASPGAGGDGMASDKPHHVIVEQLISDARQGGYLYELKRQLAAIDGRPAPEPEKHLSRSRPQSRNSKGQANDHT